MMESSKRPTSIAKVLAAHHQAYLNSKRTFTMSSNRSHLFLLIFKCLIIFLVSCKQSKAILVNEQRAKSVSDNTNSTLSSSDNALKQRTGEQSGELGSNTTFYYDPNAFLVNKAQDASLESKTNTSESKKDAGAKQAEDEAEKPVKFANLSLPAPASIAMTSGRNGRMMDLDALMGDFAAAQANRERNKISGNRQSRFLNQQQPTLEVGGGKKLHIQGFIPIVGVKDVGQDESQESMSEASSITDLSTIKQQRPKLNDLPYEQSSPGHATFGVQRYLNNDPSVGNQQVEAKYSNSMLETLKKPLKKLTDFTSSDSHLVTQQQQQQQNCLCVPFYMCKNGFISESSLGKWQIQQMIGQQQHQQLKQADQFEMKSGQLAPRQPEPMQQQQQQAQYSDSYAAIDERSFDQELVTAPSLAQASEATNQSDSFALAPQVDLLSSGGNQQAAQLSVNASQPENSLAAAEYSQEILGRMLGLKSSASREQHQQQQQQQQHSSVCGLLRSCCQVPGHLVPSQQDLANERLMAQYGNSHISNKYHSAQPQPQQHLQAVAQRQFMAAQSSELTPQQVMAVQRYQQQQQQQQAAANLPYGLPAGAMRLSSPTDGSSLMAHRSTQFQAPRAPSALSQLAQYTRSAPMQQLQSFQQQPAQPKTAPGFSQSSGGAVNIRNPQQVGTRKILEGRCGLRQAAGITGRVQNLQYHDSSADFGEYPAQAAILKRLGGSESLFVCGGTLISQYWVATAAHCIKKHAQSELKIRLGEWDVHRDDEFYPFVEKEVRDLIIHPEFVAGNLINDIALLRLDSPVDPSLPHVGPACLPSIDESFARQRCWVTGWGKDSFGQKGAFQAVLREVELPVVGQAECEQALRQTRLGPHYRLHSGFICAGGEGGRDACEGDGGSGLYCMQDGVTKVAGLVSWGIGCGQAGVPGVYVSMAHYRPWIENLISIDEDIYSPYSNMIGNSLISERNNANATSDANGTGSGTDGATTTT